MSLRTLSAKFIRGRTNGAPPAGATHVLQHVPSWLLEPTDPEGCGFWELRTLAEHYSGAVPSLPDGPDGPPDAGREELAGFAAGVLGFPVTLSRFDVEIRAAGRRLGGWEAEPAYYIIPAGGDR